MATGLYGHKDFHRHLPTSSLPPGASFRRVVAALRFHEIGTITFMYYATRYRPLRMVR